MSTPAHNFGPGGEATHAAILSAMTPDAHSVLDRHETALADHDARISALEAGASDLTPQGEALA